MVRTFRKYDADNSQSIDMAEITKMLNDLEMGHTMEIAKQLMAELDSDGSGELSFDEFCNFYARLLRGDTELRGFNKLTEALNETPISGTG